MLRVWENWSIYPPTFLNGLHATFLMAKSQQPQHPPETSPSLSISPSVPSHGNVPPVNTEEEDLDGEPRMFDILSNLLVINRNT